MLVEVTISEHRKKKVTIDADFDFEALGIVERQLLSGELNMDDAKVTSRQIGFTEVDFDTE